MPSVGIIGAGPAGLACARWLKGEGFEPVLFEQSDRLGGQWSGDPRCSGVWPSMHVNTCREMTQFSDLPHEAGTPLYPGNQAMFAYLTHYAERFGLVPGLRLRTRVTGLDRKADHGWRLRLVGPNGSEREETHAYVVVASGRFNKPALPDISGLGSFAGRGGIVHTFDYEGADRYRNQRVLVAGCAVSALEIASDLAMAGAKRVVSANRRQRYIMPKIAAGVPVEYHVQTRFAAMVHDLLPKEEGAAQLKQFFIRACGTPDQFGAPAPDGSVLTAGVTQCQHYLPLVAEGRIGVKPWITRVDGSCASFTDGTGEEFDAIILGTGFQLHLPFLSDDLRHRLGVDEQSINLHEQTFHPDLPGLAFAGLFQVGGPYLPPIELQARWIAYAWSGSRPAPSRDEMTAGIAQRKTVRGDKYHMPALTVLFAREAGVEPTLSRWPMLLPPLLFGPLLPACFRLSGRDPLVDAPRRILEAAKPFSNTVAMDQQICRLQALASACAGGPSAPLVEDAITATRKFLEIGDRLATLEESAA